jgi:hypothetical protein
MKGSPDAARRLEVYLKAVETHLAHKSPAVRRELLNELRDHVLEALRRKGGASPSVEDVEGVLAEMDAPECFAETPQAAVPAPSGTPSRRSSGRWFYLALGFLLVNGYAVWKESRRPEEAPAPAPAEAAPAALRPPLKLESLAQVDLSPEGGATLRLVFNAVPDRDSLLRCLRLFQNDGSDLEYELTGRAGDREVLLTTGELTAERVVYWLIAGLATPDPDHLPGLAQTGGVDVRHQFQFQRLDAESPAFGPSEFQARFTQPVELDSAATFVSVEPAVAFTVEPLDWWQGGGFRLAGDFKPGAIYTVTLKEGLRSTRGLPLQDPIERVVQCPDRPPGLRMATTGRYLSPRGSLQIPVSAVNLKECSISIRPVFANNLVQLAHRDVGQDGYYGPLTEGLDGEALDLPRPIVSAPNEEARFLVNVRDWTGPEPRGVYCLNLRSERTGSTRDLLVITDLGLAARVADGEVRVWVNSLRAAEPVAGAEVVLYGENNQEISRTVTDDSGLATLSCAAEDRPFVITALKDGDLSYLDLLRTAVHPDDTPDGAAYLAAGAVEAAVFTDRGVYRPGERVFLQALVRDAKLNAPEPFPVLFRVRKPDGRVFKDFPVTLDRLGSAQVEGTLPEYLPTGRYELELVLPGTFTVLGSTAVALEDFVPPQIRVTLEPPAERQAAGQPLNFSVRGEHLFGRAADGLKAEGYVTFRAAPFAPDGWKGWSFGDEEKPFSTISRPLGAKRLDGSGRAVFSADNSAAWRPPAAILAVQQVTVTEASGRAVTAYGSTRLDLYPFYIGLRLPVEGILRTGESCPLSLIGVAPDGQPVVEPGSLLIRLARVDWTSALRRNRAGSYEWSSERRLTVVRGDTLTVGGERAEWAFTPDRPGEYVVQVSDPASGASSSLRFTAAAPDQKWVEWSREKPDRVGLELDRKVYQPGDTARLLIQAPFSGTALLTVESDRVLEQRVIRMEKNTAEIEIPVRADFAPNVYCAVTLLRPATAESVWSAHRAAGAICLSVEPPDRRLQVALETPSVARPQAPLPVRVTVRDSAGAPATGEVTVLVVDEAICGLTAMETPDPLRVFLGQRRPGVAGFDLYGELMPVLEDAVTGVSLAGGDAESALLKRLNPIRANRFKPVALWQSRLVLDAAGQAAAQVDLPEFSGTLRVMAVAYNAAQVGSAAAAVKVKRALIVQPSLPRFLAPGDSAFARVEIFNESGRATGVRLRIACGGPLQALESEKTFDLAAGESRCIEMPLRAGDTPGKALCTLEVEGASETYRETIELAVRPGSGLRVQSVWRRLEAGESLDLEAPADWIPDTLSRDVWVSGEPALKLGRALDYVMSYPYGCLEQTVSGAFPLLYAADLAHRILPKSAARTDLAGFVQAGILRVLSMQRADGSFSLWPFERSADRSASLYAAHFLAEASRAAYPVPADRLDAALNGLRTRLDRETVSDATPGNEAWADDMQERAYACHVLAIAGRPDPGWNARLRELAPRLRFAARVHVASALLLSGEPRQATELLRTLGLPTERPRETGGLLNSDVKDAALLLSAWLDVEPENPAVDQMAQWLDRRQRDGHWGSTQDNAMALLALGKRARRFPSEARPAQGVLTLEGGAQRALTSTQELHLAFAPGEAGALRIANQGPGPLFVGIRLEGIARVSEPETDQGLAVRRTFFDFRGEPLDPADLPQGEGFVIRLTLDPQGRALDNLVVEDLLPAGWEIENANLATAQQFDWILEKSDAFRHRDARDDRLLLFSGPIREVRHFHYIVRAVNPGSFLLPPVTAACMYDPEIRSVSGGGRAEVSP